MKHIVPLIIFSLLLGACSEYTKIVKSNDYEAKYAYAKRCFEKKQYSKALPLFEDVVGMFKGTSRAEESLYLLAQCSFENKDYVAASQYFMTYCNTFPKGEYAELSRFYAAYALYLDSPDARLDQSDTKKAIAQLQTFLEFYPKSEKIGEAQKYLHELEDKLCYKELLAVKLYYNLGNYLGNNYLSSVITAQNVLKEYPYTKYREELMYYIVASKYQMALLSVKDKLQLRYRDVIDEYFNYISEYPDGKYAKLLTKYYEKAKSEIKEL
ncbi:MAG: outer membrane protein assembly factor BamD [Bacteroidales bacterium]|nr:outer membrane protein assembly factor BamD [Bacteroidales bacterium]